MKIAVTYEDGKIFQHFGHTEKVKVYLIKNNKVEISEILSTKGNGHSALATFLKDNGVETLICGGIGGGAISALENAGIKVYGGVTGKADEAVNELLAGKLKYDPEVKCEHHEHEHGDGHNCQANNDHECGGHCDHNTKK